VLFRSRFLGKLSTTSLWSYDKLSEAQMRAMKRDELMMSDGKKNKSECKGEKHLRK